MKPRPFAYARAETLDEVFALLGQYGDDAKILAGGQSLMATLNMRLSSPEVLIDINRIDGLSGITIEGDTLRIGALTRHAEVARSKEVAEVAPLITDAMVHVAHPAIRNRGTIGGSVAFADPAAEMPACVVALEATLVLASATGERKVLATEFFHGLYDTEMRADEVLVAIEIPAGPSGRKHCFQELARRHGDYAMIGLAALAESANGALGGVRLVYFGAGEAPVTAADAAAALNGNSADEGTIQAALTALKNDLDPPSDLNASSAMRQHLAGVLLKRAISELTQ